MFSTIGDAAVRSTNAKTRRKAFQLKIDLPLIMVVITLLVFGLLMVYSASWDFAFFLYDGNPYAIFVRQIAWVIIGSLIAGALAFMDYHWLKHIVVYALIGTILLLLYVLVFGVERNNAQRTLIEGSIQPSELAKLVVVLYMSVWLYSKREYLTDITFGLLPMGGILGFVGALILVQPDLSAVVTIFVIGGLLFFLAGADLKQIFILVVVAIFVGYFLVQINPTGSERIGAFLPGLKDPNQAHYHVQRALEAFYNGGWIGVGIGYSKSKLSGLPVPHTDSIFAVIGEELGVFGAIAVVILFVVLLWRGLAISRRAPDGLGSLLAAGLTFWLGFEAFINMAVMVNLLPFAGNALPFISAGGSSMVVSLAAVGILLNISRLSKESEQANERSFAAIVNLRRGNRRRRVSRTRRS
jgi:cell division protein FtsW